MSGCYRCTCRAPLALLIGVGIGILLGWTLGMAWWFWVGARGRG